MERTCYKYFIEKISRFLAGYHFHYWISAENKKKRKKVVNTLNDTENAVSKIENDVKLLKDQHLKTTQVLCDFYWK